MKAKFTGGALALKNKGVLVATVTRYGSVLKIAVVSPERNQPININLPSSATLREVMGAIKKIPCLNLNPPNQYATNLGQSKPPGGGSN